MGGKRQIFTRYMMDGEIQALDGEQGQGGKAILTSKLLDNQQQNQQLKCIFSCWLNCCPTPNGEVLALDGEITCSGW